MRDRETALVPLPQAECGTMEGMMSGLPDELRRLIRDELRSGSYIQDALRLDPSVGGRRRWWDRPAVFAVDVAEDIAAALLWQGGGVIATALFKHYGGRWQAAGGGAGEWCRRGELTRGRPSVKTASLPHILTIRGEQLWGGLEGSRRISAPDGRRTSPVPGQGGQLP